MFGSLLFASCCGLIVQIERHIAEATCHKGLGLKHMPCTLQ